jgi:hypothetical protein
MSGLVVKEKLSSMKVMRSFDQNNSNNKDPLWRSKAKMRLSYKNDVMIISGLGNRDLAEGKFL